MPLAVVLPAQYRRMQIGIGSFAAAHDEDSMAVDPSDRLRNLGEQSEHADEVGVGSKWHNGYGGGLWFAWLDRANTVTASYARTERRKAFYVRGGFAL